MDRVLSPDDMTTVADLLEKNRAWSEQRRAADPQFFDRLVGIQRPAFLWIGCSDSRVPANQIAGLEPGEMFVHRNVANIVVPGDSNCMAVVEYAVRTLGIRDIIVCGHYGCGGVRAVLDGNFDGQHHVERWLAPLRQIANARAGELAALATDQDRWDRLCEMNVIEQVARLSSSDVLVRARAAGAMTSVHGLIYRLRDGLLHELTLPS